MYENICYKKNFLKSVIARIDLDVSDHEIESNLSQTLVEVSKKYFPVAEPKKSIANELQISPGNVRNKQTEFMEWRFFGKDKEKILTFLPKAVFVEYKSYVKFEVVKKEFFEILDAFFDSYTTTKCIRVGLRYINDIKLDVGTPLNWKNYINPKMIGILDIYPNKQLIARAFHNLELNFGEFMLRFQFGMYNPDYPSPIRKKSYILDMDAYCNGNQERVEIFNNFDKYHYRIQEIFELSITDKLRKVLND